MSSRDSEEEGVRAVAMAVVVGLMQAILVLTRIVIAIEVAVVLIMVVAMAII